MAEITKPTDLNKIWASSGAVVAPDDAKIALGWIVEAPPHQTENYINKKHDTAFAYLNQHGVMQWDGSTEYIAAKSWVQGSNGYIYRCKQTHTAQNPVTDTLESYWALVLKGTGVLHLVDTTSYSLGFLQSSNSPATARSYLGFSTVGQSVGTSVTQLAARNALGVGGVGDALFTATTQSSAKATLGIGSASDTSEGLVERATDAEAISGIDDVRFITSKKLKLGFSISLSNNGYIAFPSWLGGLVVNWGSVVVPDETAQTVFFPKPFPSAMLQAFCSPRALGISGTSYAQKSTYSWVPQNTFSMQIQSARDGNGSAIVSWFAVGY